MKEELERINKKYNLTERSWETFWNTFDKYIIEKSNEIVKNEIYGRESIKAEFSSISYKIQNELSQDEETIEIRIGMRRKLNSVPIGYYCTVFDMDGIILDDYLIIN